MTNHPNRSTPRFEVRDWNGVTVAVFKIEHDATKFAEQRATETGNAVHQFDRRTHERRTYSLPYGGSWSSWEHDGARTPKEVLGDALDEVEDQ